jgi:hypothetical protein
MMDDDKRNEAKVQPAVASTKPLAVQVVDAIIDGVAAIAKSVVVDTAERMGRSAAKTKAGKVAASLDKKVDEATPRPIKKTARSNLAGPKKVATKRGAAKKAPAKPKAPKRPAKKATKKSSRKSPAKKAR